MENIKIKKVNKTIISSAASTEASVEISSQAVKSGFLKLFPGPSLAIFLYLVTHSDAQGYLETNPTLIASFLPEDYQIKEIVEALKFLAQNKIIYLSSQRQGDYTYQIKLNLEQLELLLKARESDGFKALASPHVYYGQAALRQRVLEKKQPSQEEIQQALLSFVPPDVKLELALAEIQQWLETFEAALLQELVRRVEKWLEKNNNPPEQAYRYLKGIIDDWYQKEIFDYKRLQHFDQLYRECRELASAYGISNWQKLKPGHMETFFAWLTEGYPLSSAVVKYAIQEAFKRKSDGHPSLKYIEDNFIKPWKKAKIRTVSEARAFLQKRRPASRQATASPKGKQSNWEELLWDFEEGGQD